MYRIKFGTVKNGLDFFTLPDQTCNRPAIAFD
jgi:hypothetical protein